MSVLPLVLSLMMLIVNIYDWKNIINLTTEATHVTSRHYVAMMVRKTKKMDTHRRMFYANLDVCLLKLLFNILA